MTRVEERVVVGTRGKIGWSDGGSGDKRRPGNLVNCRLSSPGGGSDRNYDWRADRRAARQRGRKGKSELGNERTWPSGSALSRKPSRRSGPIKRRPPFLQLGRLYFIISNSFFNMAVQHWPLRSAFFSSRGSFSRRLWPRVPAFRWWRKIGWKLWGKMVFSSFFFFFFGGRRNLVDTLEMNFISLFLCGCLLLPRIDVSEILLVTLLVVFLFSFISVHKLIPQISRHFCRI